MGRIDGRGRTAYGDVLHLDVGLDPDDFELQANKEAKCSVGPELAILDSKPRRWTTRGQGMMEEAEDGGRGMNADD